MRRRYRPHRPLPDAPPISRPATAEHERGSDAQAGAQPREGALGLAVVALLLSALLFAWGGPESTLRIWGVLVTYSLPAAGVVALWWEDWPGSRLRPRWSGFVDLLLIASCGLVLAAIGQVVVQRFDPIALFVADAGAAHAPIFPALLPLGAATFVALLQLTLVWEGWPLRRLGRVSGGTLALAISWGLGLSAERLLVRTGAVPPDAFAAGLAWISAFQVLGWVVLRGFPVTAIRRRPLRLLVGNASTVGAGVVALLVFRSAVHDAVAVAAMAAGVIGAGLVVGMLFEGWPTGLLRPAARRSAALVMTLALASVCVAACAALSGPLGIPPRETFSWAAYTLNSLATAVILHVGVFRRWPLPTTT